MKRLVTLSLFFCFAKLTIAQLYQPFPTDSAMWREWKYDVDVSYNDSWDYQYLIQGDTLISGTNYHKIFYTGTYSHVASTSYTYNYVNQYKGALREDAAKHIFYYPYGGTMEYLLYDFNLTIGDTLSSIINIPLGETCWISAIDSVLVGGQYHKQYHISSDTATGSWNDDYVNIIEGVGSTYGLFGQLRHYLEQESHLSCYVHNGITEYTDSTGTGCSPLTIGMTEYSQETPISIFPNPTTGVLFLNIPFFEETSVDILNVLGKEVYRTEVFSEETQVSISALPKGIYFLNVTSGSRFGTTHKIILQ